MIVVVDYGMGNVGSVLNMLRRIGAEAVLSSDPARIREADRLVLPGVGAFDHGMRNLEERGLIGPLRGQVLDRGVPILGICLGVQLFTRRSEEGRREGLGWIDAETVRFRFDAGHGALRIPHMGWNTLRPRRRDGLLRDLEDDARFYFVHSYHLACRREEDVLATTRYGYEFASMVARGNIVGSQFHPEKSHRFGMRLLKTFVESPRHAEDARHPLPAAPESRPGQDGPVQESEVPGGPGQHRPDLQ